MGTVQLVRYDQAAPGDVAFDRARSAYGRLVELTTRDEIVQAVEDYQNGKFGGLTL